MNEKEVEKENVKLKEIIRRYVNYLPMCDYCGDFVIGKNKVNVVHYKKYTSKIINRFHFNCWKKVVKSLKQKEAKE